MVMLLIGVAMFCTCARRCPLGVVWPREKEAEGRLYLFLYNYLKLGCSQGTVGLFSQISDGTRGSGHKFASGDLDCILGKFSSLKGCPVLEQAAQGSGGVTIPAGI